MKIIYQLIFTCLFPMLTHAQLNIQWQKSLGGSSEESAYSVNTTRDGGYIVAGFALSNNGDVQGAHGGGDLWVVKLDKFGQVQWQKALGGNSTELAYAVQQTSDGGYFAAGKTYSNNGDVSGNHGELDYWVVKLDSLGELEWQNSLGGSEIDECNYAQQTIDSGYILAGNAGSDDGDVTMKKGYYDYWVVKLNNVGDIEWEKSLGGGNGVDFANCIRQTSDGGYIVAGESNSTNGDVTGNHGDSDYWVVKLNVEGEIEWQKSLGGAAIDVARSVIQTSDGGYLVVGESRSNNGQVTGAHGGFDVWVVKLSDIGQIEWQKALGGTAQDYGRVVREIENKMIVIGAVTGSTNGDVQNNDGGTDIWVTILDETGAIQMERTFGGSKSENFYSIEQTPDKGFVLAGFTRSNDGDVSENHGEADFWVVKLSGQSLTTSDIQTLPLEIYPNPATSTITFSTAFDEAAVNVRMVDQLGREIMSQALSKSGDGEFRMDISTLPAGIYMITAANSDGKMFLGKLRKLE